MRLGRRHRLTLMAATCLVLAAGGVGLVARDESAAPIAREIRAIAIDDRSSVPFPSGTIVATTVYVESDGRSDRIIWAGGAGCSFGQPDSCSRGGNHDFLQTGLIIDETLDLDDPARDELGRPLLASNTGLITFTGFAEDKVFLTTETGGSGFYSLTTRRIRVPARP